MGKNKILILIGTIIISVCVFICVFNYLNTNEIINKEEQSVQKIIDDYTEEKIEKKQEEAKEEIKNEKYDYIGVLEIPKINLKRGLVDINSKYNDVAYNVEIINGSSMPNVENGNLILAAHSGNIRISFFKDLDNLINEDEVYIYYQNKKYVYQVVNKYEIEKTGYANIIRNKSKNTLTLITCKTGTNNQIVIICELR